MSGFPKEIIDCMKQCVLSIFWPKKDIIEFFENAGCTKRDLPKEHEIGELYRYEIVDMVFLNLNRRADYGLAQLRAIMKLLLEWNTFSGYYFDDLKKLDPYEAKRNIAHLRKLQQTRDEKIKAERRKADIKNKESNDYNPEEIKKEFLNLMTGKDKDGNTVNIQKRGYLFEQLLVKIFRGEGLSTTEPFKIQGEQIDGAIKYDGEHYLIEAKWQDALIASSDLYQFAGKIHGKLYGRGIFISINGFSPDSVKALVVGKALNTILIDGADLIQVIEGVMPLRNMLDGKIKAAQTKGVIYADSLTLESKLSI